MCHLSVLHHFCKHQSFYRRKSLQIIRVVDRRQIWHKFHQMQTRSTLSERRLDFLNEISLPVVQKMTANEWSKNVFATVERVGCIDAISIINKTRANVRQSVSDAFSF